MAHRAGQHPAFVAFEKKKKNKMQEDAAQDSSRTGPAPNPGAQDPAVVVSY